MRKGTFGVFVVYFLSMWRRAAGLFRRKTDGEFWYMVLVLLSVFRKRRRIIYNLPWEKRSFATT